MSILQGTIPDDWEGEYCRYAVCWPNSPQWLAILRGVLVLPARGRFWDEHSGNIVSAQAVIRETYDVNLHLEEVIMACNDASLIQIAAALRALAANQCCGEGAGPNGGIQAIVNTPEGVDVPFYGSQPPIDLPQGEVPPDYEGTLEEYNADKCRMAHAIVTGWVGTINGLSHISFAQTNGLGVVVLAAIFGILIVPQFTIPLLIASLIVMVLATQLLRDLADAIEENRDQIVCWMYTLDSAEAILGVLADALDVIIAGMSTTTVYGAALKGIALILMSSDTINQLFNLSQGQGPTDVDCSACVSGNWVTRVNTDFDEIALLFVPSDFVTLNSSAGPGYHYIFLQVNEPSHGIKVEFQNLVGWTQPGGNPTPFQLGQDAIGDIYDGDDFNAFAALCADTFILIPPTTELYQWGIYSLDFFTVDARFSSDA